ncbi:hypothetical protein AC612_07425 [Xanthomonas citri pv. fuscans]|nr:hypothetical protein AC612_07425 [Xanthomonas citri pv. fuscans]KGK65419.1 hypothetical protein NB99_14495 [Xanthomonas citri pv. fuscans]
MADSALQKPSVRGGAPAGVDDGDTTEGLSMRCTPHACCGGRVMCSAQAVGAVDCGGLQLMHIQHQHRIVAFAQPGAGAEQALLRADVPVTPQQASVDPQIAFAPLAHVQVHVADRLQCDIGREEQAGARGWGLQWAQRGRGVAIQRYAVHLPAAQLAAIQSHRAEQAFGIAQCRAEIDMAETVDQHVELAFLRGGVRQGELRGTVEVRMPHARDMADLPAIQVDCCVVVHLAQVQLRAGGNAAPIDHQAQVLPEQGLVVGRLVGRHRPIAQVVPQRCDRVCNDRVEAGARWRRRNRRQRAAAVLGDDAAQCRVGRRGAAAFVDRCAVVVAGEHRLEVRTVVFGIGASAQPEVAAAVHHIQIERIAGRHQALQHRRVVAARHIGIAPMRQPARVAFGDPYRCVTCDGSGLL